MAPINIDVSQATPQLEVPSPVRTPSKSDSQSFDSHLQRASEQRPSSSTPSSSTSSDSQRDRQDSSPQLTQANDASTSNSSSASNNNESNDSQSAEHVAASTSDETQATEATTEETKETDDETAAEVVATDVTPTQPPVVAVVESATPVPVAVTGCDNEQATCDAPASDASTKIDKPTSTNPVGDEAALEVAQPAALEAPHHETPNSEAKAKPVNEEAKATDETATTDVVSETDASEASPEASEGVSDSETPDVPKISSMHRYDPKQPATTHELAHEVKPDPKAATANGEAPEKVSESKPTGRRSERTKAVAVDSDDKPNRSTAESAASNSASPVAPTQVVAAAAAADALPQPSEVVSQSANDSGNVPAVTDVASTATSQSPDPPATRPLPAEPVGNTNRASSGQHQVESKRNSELSESDRARFVQRVTKAFQTASERGGPLKLRLSPPELGSVRMEVSLKDGALSARLEAETPAARAALLENLPALRERLAEQNVRIEKFDVDLQDQTTGGPGNGATSDPDTDRNPRSPHWRGLRREQESAAIAPAPVAVSASGLDQLNVLI